MTSLFRRSSGPRKIEATAPTGTDAGQFQPSPADVVRIPGYPPIGKWMISPKMSYADWLGTIYEGKGLREPINAVIVDPLAASSEEAVVRFLSACKNAGFASRTGHSSGYYGWLGDRLYPQIPSEKHHALSDEPFELHNDHGRFFGPHFLDGSYILIGALSREKVAPEPEPEHVFVSFNQARDRFAHALVAKAGFELTTFLGLENALFGKSAVGTGDHDGVAVVLRAARRDP